MVILKVFFPFLWCPRFVLMLSGGVFSGVLWFSSFFSDFSRVFLEFLSGASRPSGRKRYFLTV